MLDKIKRMLSKGSSEGLTLKDILHGARPGAVQTAGIMQVIPLLCDIEDERFASPADAMVSTTNYGSLRFENDSQQLMLIPCHTGYVVKEAAQDHAMAHAGLLKSRQKKTYETAMCIQQSQGGYISTGKHKMMVLPYSLRERALEMRDQKEYNKLWEAISEMNAKTGGTSQGNLVQFFDRFQKELEQFVAEFECVAQQVGAIVLICGEVVGVERTPSQAYWRSMWEALIRECYGSYAIQVLREHEQKHGEMPELDSRVPLRTHGIASLEDLSQALGEARAQEDEWVKQTIRELLPEVFRCTREQDHDGLLLETVEHEQFTGQILRDGERICYASLITRQAWRSKRDWQKAPGFSI